MLRFPRSTALLALVLAAASCAAVPLGSDGASSSAAAGGGGGGKACAVRPVSGLCPAGYETAIEGRVVDLAAKCIGLPEVVSCQWSHYESSLNMCKVEATTGRVVVTTVTVCLPDDDTWRDCTADEQDAVTAARVTTCP